MIRKIEHLGIAVKDLQKSEALFRKLLGEDAYKNEQVQSEGVDVSFFGLSDSKIELLEATTSDSAIARYIDKKGEGIHHIALDVDDIVAEMQRLREEGFILLNDQPKKGADNKLVCFLHPKSTNGVLVELCQENPGSDH